MRYGKWQFDRILTLGNEKLDKSRDAYIHVAAQYLAPARSSGVANTCAASTPACRELCLNTAGNPATLATKLRARTNRTRALYAHRAAYIDALIAEIGTHVATCRASETLPAIRLNGTSDIAWHRIAPKIFAVFPDVQFYDYTKVYKRLFEKLPNNYRLTYSYAEHNTPADARALVNKGLNVAVVFALTPKSPMIDEWHGMTVIDGDVSDYRAADPRGVIVGLRAKGRARRHDAWGFVQRV
jgi:hypothetical protein